MKLQKINKVLLLRYIKIWNPDSKFESYINLFSLFITTLCTSIIIIILSVNDGFKNNIIEILEDISGAGRIYNYGYESLSIDDYDNIIKNIGANSEISRFSTKECILKFNNISEGIILHALYSEDYFINQLNKYITRGEYTDSTIIIGNILSNKYNIKINDEVSIFAFNSKGIDSIKKCKVSGKFTTNIPEYDAHLIFGNINFLDELLLNKEIEYDYLQLNNIKKNFNDKYIQNNYLLLNSSEINSSFYFWLNSYDNPIKLLVLFLFVISLLNIINNNYYLVYYKKNQINTLSILGMSKRNLKFTIVMRSIILSVLSCSLGIIISYSILIIEKYFHLINLPAYVYFIEHLPIEINYYYILLLIPYVIFLTFISSLVNYNLISK